MTAAVARWGLLVAAACACATAACTIDPSENPAYRACSDGSGCGVDEHCYRGYCVPGGHEATSASIARGDAGGTRSRGAGRNATLPESAAMSMAHEPGGSAADAAVRGGSEEPPAMSPRPAANDASAPAAGTSAPELPAAGSSSEPPAAGSSSEPPQQPTPDAGSPTTPPTQPQVDAGHTTTPPPPPPDTCHAAPREQCNGQDDDCDHKTDEDFSLQSDPANCGRCGRVCANGSACCGGECVPTNTAAHCGSCEHVCTGLLQACCEGECKTLCLL